MSATGRKRSATSAVSVMKASARTTKSTSSRARATSPASGNWLAGLMHSTQAMRTGGSARRSSRARSGLSRVRAYAVCGLPGLVEIGHGAQAIVGPAAASAHLPREHGQGVDEAHVLAAETVALQAPAQKRGHRPRPGVEVRQHGHVLLGHPAPLQKLRVPHPASSLSNPARSWQLAATCGATPCGAALRAARPGPESGPFPA
jgi:hypothetical protein